MNRFSVIMTVYDNARELKENLPAFLEQDFGSGYELIVVDESSTDDTDDVLKLFKQSHSHLYTTFLPKPNRNVTRRKLALTIGVKAAKSEWVILTDIHKVPPSNDWLSEVEQSLEDSTAVMLGYYTKSGIRLQPFEELSQSGRMVRKAERIHADGHKGSFFRCLRGKYDFIVVPTAMAHELLKYYEHKVSLRRLLGLRLSVICHNLF